MNSYPLEPLEEFSNYLYIGECLDKRGILREMKQLLCYKGGEIFQATSTTEARAILENNTIKAVLVDQYLNKGNGTDFMRWMYNIAFIPTIIIIMNPSSIDIESVVALEAGATDAVSLTISTRELVARINACTRKYFHTNCEIVLNRYGINAQSIDPTSKTPLYFTLQSNKLYFSDSSRITLHEKEAKLLELLIFRCPKFVSREHISITIFKKPWNPNDRSVDNLVSRLRKAIDPSSEEKTSESIIETIRNEGYQLRIPIALLPSEKTLSSIPESLKESNIKMFASE